jgi:hypothetical protein
MKYVLPGALMLAFLVSVLNLGAADKQYQSGRIVNVERKSHERILYYLVNTPVAQEDLYYELLLQLNNAVYDCEYTPGVRLTSCLRTGCLRPQSRLESLTNAICLWKGRTILNCS